LIILQTTFFFFLKHGTHYILSQSGSVNDLINLSKLQQKKSDVEKKPRKKWVK